MKINEILKEKGHTVHTVRESEIICTVITIFLEKRIGALIVQDEHSSIKGIITERDIIRCYPEHEHLLQQSVSDIMTPASALYIVSPDDTVQHAMSIMTNERVKHIPVMKGKKLVGLISIGDAVKSLLEQSQRETKRLQDYIAGTYPEE